MPRLVGKQSNTSLYVGIALLLALAGAVGLEYFGAINVIPGFGLERQPAEDSAQ
jgi:cyanate permease